MLYYIRICSKLKRKFMTTGINLMNPGEVEIPEILSRGPMFCTTFAANNVPKRTNSDSR